MRSQREYILTKSQGHPTSVQYGRAGGSNLVSHVPSARAGLRPVRVEVLFDTKIRSWTEKSTKHFSNGIGYGRVLAGGKGCCFYATFAERKAT